MRDLMNRSITAIVASALAASVALAVPLAASAEASARSSVTRSSIRTYTARFRLEISGVGAAKGHTVVYAGSGEAALRPQLELRASARESFTFGKDHESQSGQFYLIGGRGYARDGGAGKWTESKIPGRELNLILRLINPVADQASFEKFGHVQRVGPRHRRVTGDSRQVRAFLEKELRISAADLSGLGLKSATINLWDNARHRPVKITLIARMATIDISADVAIAGYNKHLTIRAPR
jgi:hypothetical protein